MKRIQTQTQGIPFTIEVPATYEEYAQIHGNTMAALNDAIDKTLAHCVLEKIRTALADKLVAAGFPLKTKTVGEKEVTVKPDKHWFAQAFATLGWDAAQKSSVTQAIADEIGYDPSTGGRGKSSGPSEADVKNATETVAAIRGGASTFANVKAKLEGRNPGLVMELEEDGSFTVDTLAAALLFERRRIAAEQKAAVSNLLG